MNDTENKEEKNVSQTDQAGPQMTKEQLQQKPDSELLAMVTKAAGHTGKDFKEYVRCDFSYSFLTTELRNRGYANGWYKTNGAEAKTSQKPETIILQKPETEGKRLTLTVSDKTAEAWRQLTAPVSYKQVAADAALNRFITDVRSGKIEFKVKL